MIMKKCFLAAVMVLIMIWNLMAACGQAPRQSGSGASSSGLEASRSWMHSGQMRPEQDGALVVVDQAGRQVRLEAPAEKIVSCYYLVTASLLTLGQKDKVIGVEMKADARGLYQLCAPELMDLPEVGSGKETNVEAIAALEPDLVLLPRKQLEAADTLAKLGIPTAVVEPESYEAFNGLIEMLGVLCGCEEQAASLIGYYDGVVQQVTALTADVERPSVYLGGEASWLRTCAGGMYQRELIEMAGGSCVSAGLEGSKWLDISAEQLAAWDPEVIFAVQYADYTLDDIRGDRALSGVRAVRKDRLYTVPSEIEAWDYPQPSSILGLLWMAHMLHPDLVGEEDYLFQAQQFYRTYFGLEVSREQLGVA